MSMFLTMKNLVLILACINWVHTATTNEDPKKKMSSKSSTVVQPGTKQPVFFQEYQYQPFHQPQQVQPIQHVQYAEQPAQHLIPVQIIQRPYYTSQPATQPAMVIIATQPAPATPNLHSSATQLLLNYFHTNPQAKHQFLHGNQQQIAQPQAVQQAAQTQNVGSYQLIPASAYHQSNLVLSGPQYAVPQYAVPQAAAPQVATTQLSHVPGQAQAQPVAGNYIVQQPMMQLSQIAHLAQIAAQRYAAVPSLKSPPAIVTGFENFSPDQQAQIKAQLASHLGTPINLGESPHHQYSSKYVSVQQQPNLNTDEFIPSQQIKNEISGSGSSQDSSEASSKIQYNKG